MVNGDGQSTVEIPFHVKQWEVEVLGNTPSESCNPADKDCVQVSSRRQCRNSILKFVWRVSGTKQIFWSVQSQTSSL